MAEKALLKAGGLTKRLTHAKRRDAPSAEGGTAKAMEKRQRNTPKVDAAWRDAGPRQ